MSRVSEREEEENRYVALRILATLECLGIDTALPDPNNHLGRSSADIADIVSNRLALIAQKNWPEADRIRDELLSQGIQLKDGKNPETGERVTTWEVKR